MKKISLILLIFSLFALINSQFNYQDSALLDMDQYEKDKLLACTELTSYKLRAHAQLIQDVIQMLDGKVNPEIITQKITSDILNKCYYSIDQASVKNIFDDGIFMEPDFSEEITNFGDVDYSTYKLLAPNEFSITPETNLLFMKIEKAREDYIVENKLRLEQNKNDFRIFGYSIKSIPVGINVFITIAIISAIMGSLLYLLKELTKDKKKVGKKRKEK